MFNLYILHSASLNRFYIGFTADDVEKRLYKHLAMHDGFTGKAKDWKIVYTEIYLTKQEAMKREKEIKKWKSSKMIKKLISSTE